jgi:hypothetical protein
MQFKKKKIEEPVEEIKEVESPTAEEIVSKEEVKETETEEPVKTEDLGNRLEEILIDMNNRIQILESFNFRLKNI